VNGGGEGGELNGSTGAATTNAVEHRRKIENMRSKKKKPPLGHDLAWTRKNGSQMLGQKIDEGPSIRIPQSS
jgi:hypothetical protein